MDNLWPTVMSMGVTLAAIAASWGSLRQKLDSFISSHDLRHQELNTQLQKGEQDTKEKIKALQEWLFKLQGREKGN